MIWKPLTLIMWIMGIVYAQGFLSTLFAFLFHLWAWYLTIEHVMKLWGLL